jgi:hypothetical protein
LTSSSICENVTIDNDNVERDFTVQSSSQPLQITTTSLPNGTTGVACSRALQASGGQAPYSWSIRDYSAGPPPDLTLSASGVLSGAPATSGAFYFYVRVTDAASNGVDSPSPLLLTVVNPPLQITNLHGANVHESEFAKLDVPLRHQQREHQFVHRDRPQRHRQTALLPRAGSPVRRRLHFASLSL